MALNRDFNPPRNTGQRKKSGHNGRRVFLLGAFLSLVCVGFFVFSGSQGPELEARETPTTVEAPALPPAPPEPVREEIKNVVAPGSSITALLGDFFSAQEIHELNKKSRDVFPFTKICAGQPYRIVTVDEQFDSFIYEIDSEEELVVRREDGDLILERQEIVYEVAVDNVQGVIHTSLFDSIQEIGEQPELAFILADIFGWDINFILDLRQGDTFQALVQKRFRDGKSAGYGRVIAAEFVNQGQSFKAFRYQDGNQRVSFYNEKGENMRKAFLKAPLSFTRISSGYTMRRLHPIKKVWKAHPAIDYAAPSGTPVKTVGDGSITRKGYGKGNGNYLEVTHSNGYTTMYLHLKGFARGIRKGKRVTQGQVIGYVGNTGMSTGPHLDFRMKRYGKPINPLKLKAPSAKSVSKENLADYKQRIAPLLAQLSQVQQHSQVAQVKSEPDASVQAN